jgi:hypothetical protein
MTSFTTLEFKVNAENDKLLFDFVCGKLQDERKVELELLISTNSSWKEYYLDIKWVYETYGENGLEISPKMLAKEPESGLIKKTNAELKRFKNRLNKIKSFFQANFDISSEDLKSIFLDLEDIRESILNLTKIEVTGIEIEYISTIQLLCSNFQEFNDRFRMRKDSEVLIYIPTKGNTNLSKLVHNGEIPFYVDESDYYGESK